MADEISRDDESSIPLSVVETSFVSTRLSWSRSSMVFSREMEKRSSFQTTMKSRVLSSRVASEIILVNSFRVPAVSMNLAETVRPFAWQYSWQAVSSHVHPEPADSQNVGPGRSQRAHENLNRPRSRV